MRPLLLRPPERRSGSVSLRSGSFFVSSPKSSVVTKRRPGDVGLYCFIGIVVSLLRLLEELDHLLALLQDDEGLLPVRPPARVAALALHLAVDARHAHVGHLALEQRLDGLLDLRLGRVAVDLEHERLLALLEQRRLLGQERTADDLVDVLHRATPGPAPWPAASAAPRACRSPPGSPPGACSPSRRRR